MVRGVTLLAPCNFLLTVRTGEWIGTRDAVVPAMWTVHLANTRLCEAGVVLNILIEQEACSSHSDFVSVGYKL
jgi:hypothetical protein